MLELRSWRHNNTRILKLPNQNLSFLFFSWKCHMTCIFVVKIDLIIVVNINDFIIFDLYVFKSFLATKTHLIWHFYKVMLAVTLSTVSKLVQIFLSFCLRYLHASFLCISCTSGGACFKAFLGNCKQFLLFCHLYWL